MPAAGSAFPAPSLPLYLLLAAFLHGLALFWLRLPAPAGPAPEALPRLEMRLAPPPTAALPPTTPATLPPAGRAHAPARASGVAAALSPPAQAFSRPDAAAPTGSDLAAAARSFVQKESRRRSADPMYRPSPPPRSAPTPLERAAARAVPGETVLREGIVRIVTPGGKTFCLQRPPEVANRDGPAAVLAIPMNCPIEF